MYREGEPPPTEPWETDERKRGVDFVAIGEGLLPQAVNEWQLIANMTDLNAKCTNEEKIRLLSDTRPVPYYDYLSSLIGSEHIEAAAEISNHSAVERYNELVEKYNNLADQITENDLPEKILEIRQLLKQVFELFGRTID